MSKIIGIDLGTTNSAVAVMEGGSPKVIPSAEGRNLIPSVVEPDKSLVGDEIVAGKDDQARIKVKDKTYSPQEISAKILQKAKADAEAYLGEKVEKAVVTVPAYFND